MQNGELYMTYGYVNHSTITRYILDSWGKLQQLHLDPETLEWSVYWSAQNNECDVYGKCGPFGSCNQLNSPVCSCLRGFEPRFGEDWGKGNWSGGCERRTQLKCNGNNFSSYSELGKGDDSSNSELGKGDAFWKLERMKVPDNPNLIEAKYDQECESQCMMNCSCLAYAYDQGIGCMQWNGDLMDMEKFSSAGKDLYIRLPHSELTAHESRKITIIGVRSIILGTFMAGGLMYFLWMRIKKQKGMKVETDRDFLERDMIVNGENQGQAQPLPLFNLSELVIATNNFCDANKLGKGGFGPVYRGILQDGEEIAVRRLSKSSGQGLEEFKNEVLLILKLQHKNLVKLLGCCIDEEEKMLLYEYMPNKSLDAFLFDMGRKAILDWPRI